MSRIIKGLGMCFAMAMISHASAQTGVNATGSTRAERNAKQLAVSLPVIVMDKLHGHHPYLSRYRLEIYKNGRGYYYGMRDVKTLGEVGFQLTEQQVTELLTHFDSLNFWQMDAQLDFSQSPEARLRYQFLVRDGAREKQIFSIGSPQASAIHKAIEDVVNSFRWRCPYVNAVIQEDFCRLEAEFLKKDADLHRNISGSMSRNSK